MRTWLVVATVGLGLALGARATLAAPPEAATLLQDLGYSPGDIARIQAGEIVKGGQQDRTIAVDVRYMLWVTPASPAKW